MSENYRRPSVTEQTPSPEEHDVTTYEIPKKNRRNLIALGSGAAATALLAGGLFLGLGNDSEKTEPRADAGTSAPANPGEASPSASEEVEAPEQTPMSPSEAEAAFTQNLEEDSRAFQEVTIDFEQSDSKVALSYVDALSDWTMAGATDENYELFTQWSETGLNDNVSDEEFNSIPGAREISEIIADEVAENYTQSDLFATLDPAAVQLIRDINANNILANFTSRNDVATGNAEVAYESHLEPRLMTPPFGGGGDFSLKVQFEREPNTENEHETEVLDLGNGLTANNLSLEVADGSVTRANITQFLPFDYKPVEEVVTQDDSGQ